MTRADAALPPTLGAAREAPGRREQIDALTRRIAEQEIAFVYFQQVSVTGRILGKGVAAPGFAEVAEHGHRAVYSATADVAVGRTGQPIGFGADQSELVALADLDTFATLPWDPRVARVYCDAYDECGAPLDADPRQNLKRVAAEAERELGASALIGIEPEMLWLRPPSPGAPPEGASAPRCYHVEQFEALRPVLLDVIGYGQALGLEMSTADHEDAPGQLELNFRHGRPLQTADNLTTYRQVCAAVARKHKLLATFMPKPFADRSANGHHHHLTLVDDAGANHFHDPDGPAQLSDTGRFFVGGLLDHFAALTCVANPTVNSYCRMWDQGPWAPVYRNWGWQNRTCAVRVTTGARIEHRNADSSCNPYLTAAALLVAGLDGIRRRRDPGPPQGDSTADLLRANGRTPLEHAPGSLAEALGALEADEVLRAGALPGRLWTVFAHLARDDWERYLAAVTDWERERYMQALP
jgi:glutamine synthetase